MLRRLLPFLLLGSAGLAYAADGNPPSFLHKATLAVLPFTYDDAASSPLAEKMRFAVAQKMSRESNVERRDNVEVDQAISALQIPWTAAPKPEEVQQVINALGTEQTIAGHMSGRKLTLTLYRGAAVAKTVSAEIPPGKDSPRLTVEKMLTDLANVEFRHIRETQCDHTDQAAEQRFAERPNLVPDADFEAVAKDKSAAPAASRWHAILGSADYAPPLIPATDYTKLKTDRVAVIPASVVDPTSQGNCLILRMSKNVAENNGLACVSDWIPLEPGAKYRFTVRYHSRGPTLHLFLKGFAAIPDKYSDMSKPETYRREAYRAQVLPTGTNDGWELLEMDFTPEAVKKEHKIEWMRVDLYVYLHPGDVFFDDVTVKKIAP